MNILLFPLPKSKFCFEQMAEDFWGVCRRVAGGGGRIILSGLRIIPVAGQNVSGGKSQTCKQTKKLSSSDVKLSDYKGSSCINT